MKESHALLLYKLCTAIIITESLLKVEDRYVEELRNCVMLKVALDGGTRPGATLQILPLALAQSPNPRSITSITLCSGDTRLSPTELVFFQGHSVGHSFTKDDNWNCNFFLNMHFR